MKKMSFDKMSQINGGKMFGKATSCGDCYQGTMYCSTTYTIFWIDFGGGTDPMPC
jgi:hypothetical protein